MKKGSLKEWIPYEKILENGIIKLKNNSFIKLLKIYPINFNLKSDLEKESILESYKIFLKTINFNFQILIQSNKEDLSKQISNINNVKINEEKNIIKYSDKYLEYIQKLNNNKKSSSKNYYIIIDYKSNIKNKNENIEFLAEEDLNEKYFKIRECLSRCGNITVEINKKNQIKNIIYNFLNQKKYMNINQ